MRQPFNFTILGLLLLAAQIGRAEQPVRVFAAASLTDALTQIGLLWQQGGHPPASLAFAASSALAKQVEAGAPADLFASADLAWMDYLAERGKVDGQTRMTLLGNSLVLIAPRGRAFVVKMEKGFDVATAFEGKLCTGEPGVVPVGKYAKEALDALGWWPALEKRIVGTDDVRTALAFVERGECAAGIVYATDAASTTEVEVIGRFPASTHKSIVYPFALVAGARPDAKEFLSFLRASEQAAQAFRSRGFTVLPQ